MASSAEAEFSTPMRGAGGSSTLDLVLRIACWYVAGATLMFLLNNYLIFWRGWPGLATFFSYQGWLGENSTPMDPSLALYGWLQTFSYLAVFLIACVMVLRRSHEGLRPDSNRLSALSAYFARAAFWAVLLVGLADMVISFLRVEGLMEALIGPDLTTEMGRSQWRGTYIHYPLIGVAMVIAFFTRGLSFMWLGTLVVLAELQIVVLRFIFSYEQAFMGDLVRFWYAGLFLFASAHTLVADGHVRVDVLFARFRMPTKGIVNAIGAGVLGIPLCVVVLTRGMWGKSNIINSPLLSFEVSQSGFGMYTKYIMAGFLVVFALTMMIQFASYFLKGIADYKEEPGGDEPSDGEIVH
ncbi:MAG: TRAP transporter small permease subunit [Limibacillus sp.]|jgi:TRAP-type mannitol/chloroaromatic compound transport system permease small subunit